MPFSAYYSFLGGLGSLIAATLATVLWLTPRILQRRAASWLMGSCVLRALADVPDLLQSAPDSALIAHDIQSIFALLAMIALGEAARCAALSEGRRPASPWLYVAVGAAAVLWFAVRVGPSGLPEAMGTGGVILILAVPTFLGLYSVAALWRVLRHEPALRRRVALCAGVLVFALGNLFAFWYSPGERGIGCALLTWIGVAGVSAAVLLQKEFRHRVALGFAGGLAVAPFVAPLAAELNARHVAAALEARARANVVEQARSLEREPPELFRSADFALEAGGFGKLRELIRHRNPAARDAYLWVWRNGQRERFGSVLAEDGRDAVDRPRLSGKLPPVTHDGAFFENEIRNDGGGFVAAHAPVRTRPDGTFDAWLAIEYPAAIWTLQLDNARRNGASLVAMFAVFAAVGMGLMCRHAAETARQRRLERTEVADRAKSEFLAFLSHELRTPMQTVLGRTELLRHAGVTPEQSKHLDAMEREGAILLRLVTDLLDLGTIDAGRLQLRPADVSLRALLDGVMEAARIRAAAKNLSLRLEIAPDVPDAVHADDARVRQILANLVGNALKYTERGEVRLGVKVDRDLPAVDHQLPLVFTVADTGPGLPPEKIEELFTLFTRFDAGDTYRREGTGVGLALVRRLCEFMGGTVNAENRPGGGALFTVRLRFPPARAAMGSPVDEGGATVVPAPVSPAGVFGRRALVVDDNPAVCDWLCDALRAIGFDVETAGDGETALQAAAVKYFHVALLDINLPGRDGMAVARELRIRQPSMRIIGCSAEAFAVTREAARAAGMDAYLTKPVTLAELARAVSPAAHGEGSADVFARLQSPDTSARARARLVEEWPKLRAQATHALEGGDCGSLRQLGHYLHSTALLTGDSSLAVMCQRLSTAAAKKDTLQGRALVDELDTLVERWSPAPAGKLAGAGRPGAAAAL